MAKPHARPGTAHLARPGPTGLRRGLPALLALMAGVACCAAHAQDTSCAFRVRGPLVLTFGALDPASHSTVIQQATGPAGSLEIGACDAVVSMRAQVLNATGLLRHTDGQSTLRYTLVVEPSGLQGPGSSAYVPFRIIGTILPEDYRKARPGTYTEDNLRVEVTP